MTLLWVRLSYQSRTIRTDTRSPEQPNTRSCSRLPLNWFCFEYPDIPNHQRIASDRVYPGQA
jgi:hypothetical protein